MRCLSLLVASLGAASALRVALCQFEVGTDKEANIATARAEIAAAAADGAKLVVLPEIWNGPYATTKFAAYAEPVPSVGSGPGGAEGPSVAMLRGAAAEHNVTIVGGSIAEVSGARLFNTCVVVGADGVVLAVHRKLHLFDIDIPGKTSFRESDSLSPGGAVTTFTLAGFGVVGVGICYDLRFAEYALALRARGARLLVYPGAFTTHTGEAHWDLLNVSQQEALACGQLGLAWCAPREGKALARA